jgi:hypothetical protein
MKPEHFINNIYVPTASGTRQFRAVAHQFQLDRLRPLLDAIAEQIAGKVPSQRRHFWVASKGASKDQDGCLALLYLLTFAPTAVRIQIGAYDQLQASETLLIAKQVLAIDAPLNRALASILEVQADRILNTRTGGFAECLTTDSRGSHGSRPQLVWLNEISHVADQEFANTLADNAAKVPTSITFFCGNAGHTDTWQHQWWKTAQLSDDWTCHEYARPAPWLDAKDIADAERRNPPSRFRRLFYSEWASAEGDQLDRDHIDRSLVLPGPTMAPVRGRSYFIGCDLALRRDAAAVVMVARHDGEFIETPKTEGTKTPLQAALEDSMWGRYDDDGVPWYTPQADNYEDESTWHPGTGHIELAQIQVFTPRAGVEIDLARIGEAIAARSRAFSAPVLLDEYQAALLAQRLRSAGIAAQTVAPTGPALREMATLIMDGLADAKLKLWPQPALVADLRRARLVEKSFGLRLQSPSGIEGDSTRHGDALSAYALAVLCSQRYAASAPQVANFGQPLVCWP